MPSSSPLQISQIVEIVRAAKPQSVLDIGIGFGKYGFLCREYLELWDGRDKYNDWQRRIDGIEAFEGYITPLHKMIYSNIYVGNALDIVPALTTYYDLILMIDVIEHFTLKDGLNLLEACAQRARACVISTPLEVTSQQSAFGNEFETHRSRWGAESLSDYPEKIIIPSPQGLLCYIRFDGVRLMAGKP